jgi:hypothetical protein
MSLLLDVAIRHGHHPSPSSGGIAITAKVGQFEQKGAVIHIELRYYLDRKLLANVFGYTENEMKKLSLAAMLLSLSVGFAMAQGTCESRAVSRDGKPLAGAAKTSFIKKCKTDICAGKAIGKDGKPLHGAAKNSFMKKCRTDA